MVAKAERPPKAKCLLLNVFSYIIGYTIAGGKSHLLFVCAYYFLDITAPTLWIKHLVIKDAKLNGSSMRQPGIMHFCLQ